MSSTTTTATVTEQDYLRDYTIRLTGAQPHTQEQQPPRPSPSTSPPAAENPSGWDNQHRQVPHYRPINTSLDRDSRPWGSNPVETAIIFTMMHGVWLKGSISWLWRNTGGRFNQEAFTATIGGES